MGFTLSSSLMSVDATDARIPPTSESPPLPWWTWGTLPVRPSGDSMSEQSGTDTKPAHDPEARGLRLVPVLLGLTVVSGGLIDAVSYLGLEHVFTANMTGNVVVLGFAAAGAPGFSVEHTLTSLGSFVVGAMAGGRVAVRLGAGSRRTWARLTLAAEAVLLGISAVVAFAAPGATATAYTLIAVTAFAMGLRNATVRRLGVPDLTTTVLTMTLTGLAADSRAGGGPGTRSPPYGVGDRDGGRGRDRRVAGAPPRPRPSAGDRRGAGGPARGDRLGARVTPFPGVPRGARQPAYLARKASSAEVTSSAWVHSRPCGAPSISTYSADGSSAWKGRPVASMGRMRSPVPCRISAGTSIFATSARKSVIQVGTQATEACAEAPAATFQLPRTAASLIRLPSVSSRL
ncbi:hypothetical protein SFUMM280S_02716 [Streptomyces fumanus]